MFAIFLCIIGVLVLVVLLVFLISGRDTGKYSDQRNKSFREKYCNNDPVHYVEIPLKKEDILKKHNKDYAFMVFDCETTGLPQNGPTYIIQLSWLLLDKDCKIKKEANYYIKPPIPIPLAVTAINHITNEDVETKGSPLDDVLVEFSIDALKSYRLVAHNFEFDSGIIDSECHRLNLTIQPISHRQHICTMEKGTKYCQILKADGSYKRPKLAELAQECKVSVPDNMHDSMIDTQVTAKCLKHMLDYYVFKVKGIND